MIVFASFFGIDFKRLFIKKSTIENDPMNTISCEKGNLKKPTEVTNIKNAKLPKII